MSSGRFQKKATDRSVISCGGNVFEPGATAQASRLPAAVYRATRLDVREHDHVCGRTVSGIRVNAFQLPCGNAGGLAAHSVVAVCAVGRRICGCDDRRKLLIVSEIVMTAGSLALAINGMLAHSSVVLIF